MRVGDPEREREREREREKEKGERGGYMIDGRWSFGNEHTHKV